MNMTSNGNTFIIALEGRIDSNNAPATEQDILGAIAEHAGMEVCFDASKLEYISSAGLRILMKVRKTAGKALAIENVSRDVYDVLETTGFTGLFEVKQAYREISLDGLEVIGRGFFGTVYRIDPETIVKMYKGKDSIPMIENEKKMAQKAFLAGIPTAISYDIVKAGEDYGSVFELLNAKTFNDIVIGGEEPLEELVARYAALLKHVHRTTMRSGDFPSYKERFLDYLEEIRKYLSDGQYEGLHKLLQGMPEEYTVVHGDIQMKNVMQTDEEAMLIDMDTLGLGNPVFEFAALYVTYVAFEEDDPGNSMAFLGIPSETSEKIWKLVLENYFSFENEKERESVLAKIRLAAALRFLYLLESTDLKNGVLGETRIAHTRAHIEELLPQVTELAV